MKKQTKKFESIKNGKFNQVAINHAKSARIKGGMITGPDPSFPMDQM